MGLFHFLKRDNVDYYQWFEDAANNTLQAAQDLRELCYNYQDP
jgi:hypothetical protein